MKALVKVALTACVLAGVQGCSDAQSQPPVPAPQPELVIVLVDRSMSRTQTQMESDRRLLKGLIQTLNLGDRLILSRVHAHGQSDDVTPWTSNAPVAVQPAAPTMVERQALKQWRGAAAKAAETIFDTTLARRTDLLASFADGADYIKESRRPRTRIVVFSDMLQSTPGMDFERVGPPAPSWIETEQGRGTLPKLPGACVVVVGAETRTARGAAVRTFWGRYVEAAGGRLPEENYRYTATEAGGLGC